MRHRHQARRRTTQGKVLGYGLLHECELQPRHEPEALNSCEPGRCEQCFGSGIRRLGVPTSAHAERLVHHTCNRTL